MGVGNLQDVIAAYVRPRPLTGSTPRTVAPLRHHLRAAVLRLDAAPQRGGLPQARLAGRRLAPLPVQARRGRHDHAPARREERPARPDRLAPDRQGERREPAAPAGPLPALRGRRRPAPGLRQGRADRAARRSAPAGLPRSTAGMGSLARRIRERRRCSAGLRPEALATLLYITKEVRRDRGRVAPARDEHGARPEVPARARRGERPGHARRSRCTRPASRSTCCATSATAARSARSSRHWSGCAPRTCSTSSTSRRRSTSRSAPRASGCCRCWTAGRRAVARAARSVAARRTVTAP